MLPQYTSKAVLQEIQDLETYIATLLMKCTWMMKTYSRPVTNSPIGGFSRDVRHVAKTGVPTTLSPKS